MPKSKPPASISDAVQAAATAVGKELDKVSTPRGKAIHVPFRFLRFEPHTRSCDPVHTVTKTTL